MTKDDKPEMAIFSAHSSLVLEPIENGGWVVCEKADAPGYIDRKLGAYSTTEDMLAALQKVLSRR